MKNNVNSTIYPNKNAYFVIRNLNIWVIGLFLSIVIGTLLSAFFSNLLYLILGFGLFILISILNSLLLYFKISKESYLLEDKKIINTSGSILSDYKTEVNIKNITNISLVKTIWEEYLFGTSSIFIQSAGSGDVEISFKHINNPQEVYNNILDLMRDNGFSAKQDNLMHATSPSLLASIIKSFQYAMGSIIGVYVFITATFPGITNFIFSFDTITGVLVNISLFIVLILFTIVFPITFFGDTFRRKYKIYEDSIVYEKNFLVKEYSIIPIENIADSNTNRNFIDRLIGTSTMIISCQGTNQEIVFANMPKANEIELTIDNLVKNFAHKSPTKENHDIAEDKTIPLDSLNDTDKYIFSINPFRYLFPYFVFSPLAIILFPLLLIWIPNLIRSILVLLFTKYSINENSFSINFDNYLSVNRTKFTLQKVTSITFKENFFDKLFDTQSVIITSIGSNLPLEFKSVSKSHNIKDLILKKFNFQYNKNTHAITPKFTFLKFMQKNISSILTLIFLFIFSIFIALLISTISRNFESLLIFVAGSFFASIILIPTFIIYTITRYYFYKKFSFVLHENHTEMIYGIINISHVFVLYENIKDIIYTKYPFTDSGEITFNIAGELVSNQIQTNNSSNIVIKSNIQQIAYLDNTYNLDQIFDTILTKSKFKSNMLEIDLNKDIDNEELISTNPDLFNHLFMYIILFCIFPPTIVFLPFIINYIRNIRYILTNKSITKVEGIILKTKTTIVYNKIDHTEVSEGAINKLFGTKNILIYTVGNSTAELNLVNIKNINQFQDLLNKQI
jgi:membrane protein YdbS with pleckstrin-like domain